MKAKQIKQNLWEGKSKYFMWFQVKDAKSQARCEKKMEKLKVEKERKFSEDHKIRKISEKK